MTDPSRLLDQTLEPVLRSSLEAAIAAEPPASLRERLWDEIALTLPAAGVLLDATTSSSATATATATTAPATLTTATTAPATLVTATTATDAVGLASKATVSATTMLQAIETTTRGASTKAILTAGSTTAAKAAVAAQGVGLGAIAGKAVAIGLGIGLGLNAVAGVVERNWETPVPTAKSAQIGGVPRTPEEQVKAVRVMTPSAERVPMASEPSAPTSAAANAPAISAQRSMSEVSKPSSVASTESLDEARGAPTTDELRDESQLLSRAREALRDARAGAALEFLGEHERRYSEGRLRQEREALYVQALVRAGRTTEAQRRGKSFLASFPMSPHSERIRALLRDDASSTQ